MKTIMKNLSQPDKLEGKIFRVVCLTWWLTVFIYAVIKLFPVAHGFVCFGLIMLAGESIAQYFIKWLDAVFAIKNKRPMRNFRLRTQEP